MKTITNPVWALPGIFAVSILAADSTGDNQLFAATNLSSQRASVLVVRNTPDNKVGWRPPVNLKDSLPEGVPLRFSIPLAPRETVRAALVAANPAAKDFEIQWVDPADTDSKGWVVDKSTGRRLMFLERSAAEKAGEFVFNEFGWQFDFVLKDADLQSSGKTLSGKELWDRILDRTGKPGIQIEMEVALPKLAAEKVEFSLKIKDLAEKLGEESTDKNTILAACAKLVEIQPPPQGGSIPPGISEAVFEKLSRQGFLRPVDAEKELHRMRPGLDTLDFKLTGTLESPLQKIVIFDLDEL